VETVTIRETATAFSFKDGTVIDVEI